MSNKRSKSGRRFEQLNRLVDEICPRLQPLQSWLLLICWRHANEKGQFRLSVSRMVRQTTKSKRTVQRNLRKLMERGAIRIIDGPKGTSTTTYQITGTILDNPTKRQLVGDIAGL